jgi:hypothetical protein
MGATRSSRRAGRKGDGGHREVAADGHAAERVRGRVGSRWGALYEATETHAAEERDQYVQQTASDALKLRLSARDGVLSASPTQVQSSIDETKAILSDFGKHEGLVARDARREDAAAVSGIHGRDRSMVANRQDLAAAEYCRRTATSSPATS